MKSRSNVIDFNPPSASPVNDAINAAMDAAALIAQRSDEHRNYLGASSIGSECLRKVQFDWQRDAVFPGRTKRIFERGHASENKIAELLTLAGFKLERVKGCEFSACDGMFKGHCDANILDGPAIEGLIYPCLWENKCLGASGWKKIEKYGLRTAYPHYYDQVQIYMAYLGLDENPALFTAENADTCHLLALTVPFDAEAAQAASDRAVSVIRATKAHELMPRITEKGPTDWRCKMCSHSGFCWS